MAAESVLLNHVYCHPVGHAVEAVQYCVGLRRADPGRHIGVVLHAHTATDLAAWCDAVDAVYTVDIDVFTPPQDDVAAHIPAEWDWVVDDPRGHMDWQRELFPGLARYYDLAERHFHSRRGHVVFGAEDGPRYEAGHGLRLALPEHARDWARQHLPERAGPTVGLLPGGSADRWRYPTLSSWQRILDAMRDRFPTMRLCLTGKLASDGRTATGFSHDDYTTLAHHAPDTRWAVDVGLDRQLAAVERCDLFLAPHTGFAFAALAVGTPWLALAGNDWAEYYFNPGVPFYSVLPDITRFPSYVMLGHHPDPVDDEGPRSPSMSAARLDEDLPELLDGAEWLLSGRADFDTALRCHARRLHALFDGRTELMFAVDNLLVDALGQ